MIGGAHTILYSKRAEEVRAFFRDVLAKGRATDPRLVRGRSSPGSTWRRFEILGNKGGSICVTDCSSGYGAGRPGLADFPNAKGDLWAASSSIP